MGLLTNQAWTDQVSPGLWGLSENKRIMGTHEVTFPHLCLYLGYKDEKSISEHLEDGDFQKPSGIPASYLKQLLNPGGDHLCSP